MKKLLACIISVILLYALLLSYVYAEEPDPNARFRGIPTIELDGSTYRFNRRLTTVLLIGVDKLPDQEVSAAYHNGGQADFIALLVINDADKSISMIQINRDTMSTYNVYNLLGEVSGTRFGQLCLTHAFGKTDTQACEMTVDAISTFLNDTPIDYYISMDMGGIATLNDALGGVQVTLQDDFSAYDPSMTAGKELVLKGAQAEYFVRSRFDVGDRSNLSRQQRQHSYIKAALERLKERMHADSGFIRSLHAQMEPYLTSSISRGALYNMGDKATRYSFRPIMEIGGEAILSEAGFMEFHHDAQSLKRILADVLYEKVG